jgi:UDP-glucose 4-epimerase
MKYFVIGGAGFIGSILVKELLTNKKNTVTVFDDLSSGKLQFLDFAKSNNNFNFIKGTILNKKKLSSSMKGHNFIYHLAANPDIRQGIIDNKLDLNINLVGTINVLDSMLVNKINKIAFASSSAVFGTPTKLPTSENYGPSLPESFYGASKLACEGFISAYSNIYNFKSWIFRFANITGYPATHGIIYDFYKKIKTNSKKLEILGNGKQKKSYITNDMLVDAMLFVIKTTKNNQNKINLFNIGNNDAISVREITNAFVKLNKINPTKNFTGTKIGWKGDVPIMNLDVKKLKNLGWKPNKNSKSCIDESIVKNKL